MSRSRACCVVFWFDVCVGVVGIVGVVWSLVTCVADLVLGSCAGLVDGR